MDTTISGNPTLLEDAAAAEFAKHRGELLLNRKVVSNPYNVQFFAALFSDFVPLFVKDIGKDRLVYTGLCKAFRALEDGEKPPRYKLAVSSSSKDMGAWKLAFTEIIVPKKPGIVSRLFGRKEAK